MSFIIYYGAVLTSFFFCFSIQATYKIRGAGNGFLFWILCVSNLIELFVLLKSFFIYKEITDMFIFVILISTVSVLKIITIVIYHFLYPNDKEGRDSMLFWSDLWKGLAISLVFAFVMLFICITIFLSL